jgi:hypothetical protein
VRLGAARIAPAGPGEDAESGVPAPPSALPPGPLRVTAEFAAEANGPLPAVAARLRAVLAEAAARRLGLTVTDVDLTVTALLDEPLAAPGPDPEKSGAADTAEQGAPDADADGVHGDGGSDERARVRAAALGVPGVLRLTGGLGGAGRAVHIGEPSGDTTALPRRHVRVDLAVGADRRTLDVVREVRAAVDGALRDHPTVAVLVTAVG